MILFHKKQYFDFTSFYVIRILVIRCHTKVLYYGLEIWKIVKKIKNFKPLLWKFDFLQLLCFGISFESLTYLSLDTLNRWSIGLEETILDVIYTGNFKFDAVVLDRVSIWEYVYSEYIIYRYIDLGSRVDLKLFLDSLSCTASMEQQKCNCNISFHFKCVYFNAFIFYLWLTKPANIVILFLSLLCSLNI